MRDTNSLRDEIKKEQAKMKDQPFSKKLSYFFYYYWLHVTIVVIAVAFVSYTAWSILSKKDCVLNIAYINTFTPTGSSIPVSGFEEYLGIDPSREEVILDASFYISDSMPQYRMSYEQKILTMTAAKELDVIVCDKELFTLYAEQGFFQDLSTILEPELLSSDNGKLLMVDVIDDSLEHEVAVGIDVSGYSALLDSNSYPEGPAYAGVVTTSQRVSNATAYLEYITSR